MPVTVRGTDTADSGGVAVTSLNLTVPATTQAGDVGYLIADTANTSRTGVAPTGWTMVGGTHYTATGLRAWLYRRDMTGAQAGTTITVGLSGTGVMTAGLLVLAGGSSASEVIAGPTTDLGDNTTMTTVAVTPSANDALLIHLASVRYSSLTTSGGTAPTGFTEVFDYDNGATSGSNGRHGVYAATKQLTGQAGVSQASVNGSWASTARDHTWTIALGPAAATTQPAAGTTAATSATSGAGSVRAVAAGVAAAVALTSGAGVALMPAAGTVAATSSTSGSASVLRAASGTSAATSDSTGSASTRAPSAGSVAAVSATTGAASIVTGAQTHAGAGTVAATSSTSGSASVRLASAGTSAATTGVAGSASTLLSAAGTIIAASATTAAATLRASSAGIVAATADNQGSASALLAAAGSADAVSSTSGVATGGTVLEYVLTAGPPRIRFTVGAPTVPTLDAANPRVRFTVGHPRPPRFSTGGPL